MPGTIVRDALEPDLEAGVTLNAAGTTNGTAKDVLRPQEIRVELATATVSGTSPTLDVEIQASDDSSFSSGVVSLGRFAQLSGAAASQSNVKRYLQAYTPKRYVRARVTIGGTSPSYAGTTIRVREPHYFRASSDTA